MKIAIRAGEQALRVDGLRRGAGSDTCHNEPIPTFDERIVGKEVAEPFLKLVEDAVVAACNLHALARGTEGHARGAAITLNLLFKASNHLVEALGNGVAVTGRVEAGKQAL